MSIERSGTAFVGGVLGNIGSCHSKWGVERPWNTVESRETILPRGRENLAYVFVADSFRKPSAISARFSSREGFDGGCSVTPPYGL